MTRPQIRSLAVIANGAFSIVNFRGPLIKAIVASGVRVYALAPDYDDDLRRAVMALGAMPVDYRLERTGMRPLRDLADAVGLWRLLRKLKPDATFGYFIKPVIYGSLSAWAAGVPRRYALVAGLGYVFIDDGRRITWGRRLFQWLVMQLYRLGFAACDRVFFQNEDDIDHFAEWGAISRKKALRLAGTGVDLTYFLPAPPVIRPIRFLLVARLLREKGLLEFVAAARELKTKYPAAEFVVAGGLDPNPGGITAPDVERWRSEGVVDFLGHIDDVRAEIVACSVFVLPSYREGMPRCNQEAMAIARPVVTTDVAGCRETVIDGETGFIVPLRDFRALARAMERFILDPDLIGKMGAAGRVLAERRFDVRAINAVMLAAMDLPLASNTPADEEKKTGAQLRRQESVP